MEAEEEDVEEEGGGFARFTRVSREFQGRFTGRLADVSRAWRVSHAFRQRF